MSEVLDRLESRAKAAGWQIGDRFSWADGDRVNVIRWRLVSRFPPLGVEVELRLRLIQHWGCYYDWDREYPVGAAIRYPQADEAAQPDIEANLGGDEITRDNWSQLMRVLAWFRDPLSNDYWSQPVGPDDWSPPADWLAKRWGHQAGMEPRWPVCTDAQEMLRYMPEKPSDRKRLLIACACCRLLRLPMRHERNLAAVVAVERYAEQGGSRREMKKLCRHSDLPWLNQFAPLALAMHSAQLVAEEYPSAAARAADVVREIVGNPFRAIRSRREWVRVLGGAVSHLAETIATEERYEEMPILADALEDAECTESALLDHCRQSLPHLRGCWVLDLLRGRK